MDAALDGMAAVGLIKRYEVGEQQVIQIEQFDDHQSGLHKRTASRFPLPDGSKPFREPPGTSGNVREVPPQRNVTERKRREENVQDAEAATTEPAILTYPTNGKPNEWHLTQAHVDDWETLYPSLDILAECRKALAWVRANPSKRKTASGMPRTLVSWFNRANDRPSVNGRASPPLPPKEELEVWCKRCGLDPAVDVRGSGCDRCRYLPDTEARKLYDQRPTA